MLKILLFIRIFKYTRLLMLLLILFRIKIILSLIFNLFNLIYRSN
jgi:hypothetical protein